MIELGKSKIVPVKRCVRKDGKPTFYKVVGTNGEIETKCVNDEVWRICREPIGPQFGRDKRRKLCAGLVAIDQLVLYPQGTRQEVRVNLVDVYAWALRSRAQRAQLETARERKLKLKAARIKRQIAAADRKLRNQLKHERTGGKATSDYGYHG